MTTPKRGATEPDERVGLQRTALDTPSLLVDLATMDANIARIADSCRRNGVAWRPHVKGQKTVEIAWREIAAGAIGVTCAKLGEAEVMAEAGIERILVANQIVGAAKIERLMRLMRTTEVIVAVDGIENLEALATAAREHGVVAPLVIEVDVGMKRAGVPPGAPAVALAKRIAATQGVRLAGVMAWEAHAARIAEPAEKARLVREAVGALVATAAAIREAGCPVEIVSCGGTGTYLLAGAVPGVTEIQAGGGVFSDVAYRTLYQIDHPCALTILSTVTSRPAPNRIVCDAGRKSMSGDVALPQPLGLPGVVAVRLSAEHAVVELDRDSEEPRVGDIIEFVVGYSDTTVHLHDEIHAIRDGRVEAVWPVAARGKTR